MRKFENVDIVNSLRQIMNINTEHYKSDFVYDVEMIRQAALSSNPKDKSLLFMSRLNGTYCYRETDVFTKDTSAYNTWEYYGDQTQDKILAYAVKITGMENEVVKGNLYELDYRKHFMHVINVAVQPDNISANEELNFTLSCEHQRLERLKYGDIDKHIADLSKKKIKAQLDKMTEDEKQDIITHVELSRDFGEADLLTQADVDLYNAVIAERAEQKPSIRKQLAENKGKTEPTKPKTQKKEDISL